MILIDTNTKSYPLNYSQVIALYPAISFPPIPSDADLAAVGVARVEYTNPPAFDAAKQYLTEDAPTLVNGAFQQVWRVKTLPNVEAAQKLRAAKDAKIKEIKAERDRRKFNGVKVDGKWIHTDTYSRTQWMALIMDRMLLGVAMQPIPWTTMDGSIVPTTIELATAVFTATKTLDVLAFSRAAFHISQVETSADPASYDYSAGWPETFGG